MRALHSDNSHAEACFVSTRAPVTPGNRKCSWLLPSTTARRFLLLAVWSWLGLVSASSASAAPYADRLVWILGGNLNQDSDVAAITAVLDAAGRHGLNGAVVRCGLDTLCKQRPDFFRRLDQVKQACDRNKLELIPAVFSVGGGTLLPHDRYLAEGLPVDDAPFLAREHEARFMPDPAVRLVNGGFEQFQGHKLAGFKGQDQPGVVSFVDTQVKHAGRAALRLENFASNPFGHGRVVQVIKVRPHRAYRLRLWVRTAGLEPAGVFKMVPLAGNHNLAPRDFSLPATADWQLFTLVFNSLEYDTVGLHAGVWGGKTGRFWIDDWSIEEIGPLNVLRRPGTPVTVRSDDGATTFVEGRDYAPLEDPDYNPSRLDRDWPALRLLPGGRIRDGQRLRVSWYHPQAIFKWLVPVCMGEPALHEIFDHESRLLAERLHPRRVMLNMDEIRMGGTCRACQGRDMAEVLGECVTRQAQALRRHNPGAEIYIWSDMLDPTHNARASYYFVKGGFAGSWKHIPKDLVIAVWGDKPREQSLRFFAEQGFRTLGACYYDAKDLTDVKGWLRAARSIPNVRGFMYTPWQRKYELLPSFGDLLKAEGR